MSLVSIQGFLEQMIRGGASDLHLSPGGVPMIRLHGDLARINHPPLKADYLRQLILSMAPQNVRDVILQGKTTCFAFQSTTPTGTIERFRVTVYPTRHGLSCAIRHIRSIPPTIEELGIPPIVPTYTSGYNGLIIVAGATGSGKSSTLAACIRKLSEKPLHIITIEDPIEFLFESDTALIHQREIGSHVTSYEEAITEALRQDPDVIVIGEVRTAEEIRRALHAAETGHLVFTTVHASSAEKAIARLVSVFPADEHGIVRTILAEQLRCIVCQKLIRRRDKKGRVAAVELMVNTPAVASLIRDGKTHQLYGIMQASRGGGMQTMNDALAQLIKEGEVDHDDAMAQSNDPSELERMLRSVARF